MSRYLVDRIMDAENVELLANTEVRELVGEDRQERGRGREQPLGRTSEPQGAGPLRLIGAGANTDWLEGAVELDEDGFIPTGRALLDRSALEGNAWWGLSREPYLSETSLPGIFAAGDVRGGSVKRVASAVGEGSMALRFVHHCLADTG